MTTTLRVTQAYKRFGTTQALDGAEVTLERGELLLSLGPNGAGKTTLIRSVDFDPQTVGGKLRPGRFGGREFKDISATPITHLQTLLAEIGYSVGPANGQFNQRTARAVRHFQVHFEGRSNNETINAQTAVLIRAVRDANPRAD
jgi:ABC-type polar amino acid transport system ATPase subunit